MQGASIDVHSQGSEYEASGKACETPAIGPTGDVVKTALAEALEAAAEAGRFFFEVRRGLFRAPGESVAAFVDLTRKRLATEIEWMRFARRSTTLVAVAVAFWAAWAFVKHFDQYAAEPWRAVVGFGGAVVILGGLAWWIPRKHGRLTGELGRFEEVVGRASLDVS